MNKKISVLILLALSIMVLQVMNVSAAVTGCIGTPVNGAYPQYNDTGVVTNVTEGNVCRNATLYNVDPSILGYCTFYRSCVIGSCQIDTYYAGFKNDGSGDCSTNTSLLNGTVGSGVQVGEGYRVNATKYVLVGGSSPGFGCSVVTAAATVLHYCGANLYTVYGNTSFCDGVGAALADSHVAAGDVCIAGVSSNPNASVKCGTWYNCVKDQSAIDTYYVGYAASGSACSDTGWQASGTYVDLASGLKARYTEHSATLCSTAGYNPAYTNGDLNPIVTDGIGTAGASVVSLTGLIVVMLVLLFLAGIIMKAKGLF